MALRTSILVSLALAVGGGAVRADNVDWSQYIDKNASTSPAPPSTPPPVVTSSKSTRSKKAVAAKPKSAKAKRGARRHR
jgi:hypothetical protein